MLLEWRYRKNKYYYYYSYLLQDDRVDILCALTRRLRMCDDVNLSALSEACVNFTGADMKALLYNAQLEAIHEVMDASGPDGMLGRDVESADNSGEVDLNTDTGKWHL